MRHLKQANRLWDNVIPDTLVLPGRAPGRQDPEGENLVFKRIPKTNFAVYSVDFGRDKLHGPPPKRPPKVL